MLKKILLLTILLALSFTVFLPSKARADVKSFASCAGTSIGAAFASNLINDGLNALKSRVPGLSLFLGGSEVPVGDSGLRTKETILDSIARCSAREILAKMNSSILSAVRTGGLNGGPAFVRNWRNFATDAEYRGEGVFKSMLSNTQTCDYFGKDLKSLFGITKKLPQLTGGTRTGSFDSFASTVKCTLPSNFKMDAYQKNFSKNGGWQAFSRILEPQNNYYGALFNSLGEAGKQRAAESQAAINEAIAGQGFTSTRGKSASDNCKTKDDKGKCIAYKDVKSPGSYLKEAAANTVQQELAWISNADELNEVIASAIGLIFNRVFDLSNSNEGDLEIPTNPNVTLTPPEEVIPPPADALVKHPPRTDIVIFVKAKLEEAGFTASSECEVYEIPKRVAWALKDEGAGLLIKPSGENICDGHSISRIVYDDGYMFKILSDAGPGGGNGPQWVPEACGTLATNGTCPDRYDAPSDPGSFQGLPIPGGPGGSSTVTANLTSDKASMCSGESASLSWTVTGTGNIALTSDNPQVQTQLTNQLTGTRTVSPDQTNTYTLAVTGPDFTVAFDTVTITVTDCSSPPSGQDQP